MVCSIRSVARERDTRLGNHKSIQVGVGLHQNRLEADFCNFDRIFQNFCQKLALTRKVVNVMMNRQE